MGDLLAIKSARLSDFNGKSLNVDDKSELLREEELNKVKNPVAIRVYKWFSKVSADARSEGIQVVEKL